MKNTEKQALISAIATAVSTAVVTVLDDFDFGTQSQAKSPKITPTKSRNAHSTQAHKPTRTVSQADENPDVVELTVSLTATDKRLKLPARIFDRNNRAYIDGELFQGQPNDAGRCKVQPSFFGATVGQTVRIMRDSPRSNKWTSALVGKGTSKPAPKPSKSTAPAPTSTKRTIKRIAPVKRDRSAEMAELVSQMADKAIANASKRGFEPNANLPEDDARRFLSSRDKKAFNKTTNAYGYKLADAIEMLNDAVYE